MQEAVPVGEGSMAAMLGLNIDELQMLKRKDKGVCEIANTMQMVKLLLVEKKV